MRIPIHTEHKGCVKICQCTENRLIEKCQPLPCVPVEECWLGNKKIGKYIICTLISVILVFSLYVPYSSLHLFCQYYEYYDEYDLVKIIIQNQQVPIFGLEKQWIFFSLLTSTVHPIVKYLCILGHGTTFYSDCNVCNCYAGEITCSKKQCEGNGRAVRRSAWASLPCNCHPHYVPVCGRNGNTYPNACLAK